MAVFNHIQKEVTMTRRDIRGFLNQDIRELWPSGEVVEGTAEVSGAALGLAIALGIVASPAATITVAAIPFIGLIKRVIDSFRKNKEFSLEKFVSTAAKIAYLKSFTELANTNQRLAQLSTINTEQNEIFGEFKLNQELATNALRCFHRSELAAALNRVLCSYLEQQGLDKRERELIASWVAWKTESYLQTEIQQAEGLSKLASIYNAGAAIDPSPYSSIETYLTERIATKPEETVFAESFTFRDIYIPLKARPVDDNGKIKENKPDLILEQWAKEKLEHPSNRVMFIQGGPGRGKTVFCRLFADWVRQNLHPLWTPILIRLRDITTFEQSFTNTLKNAIPANFTTNSNWLTKKQQRFLFILDGFDELRMEGRIKGGIERFIQQVSAFQNAPYSSSEMGHRIIITGRQLALQGISYLPDNLERVELIPLDHELQQQWFKKWSNLVGKEECESFQQFLQGEACPKTVKQELAREPLLLYLLGAMHRDGKINLQDLAGKQGLGAKIQIYEQSLDWVLTEQREEVQKELVRLEPPDLVQILMEAGLCVVQSRGEYARVKAIEQRLSNYRPDLAKAIEETRTNSQDEVLKNALAAFYLKPAGEGAVEFFHKSFSEFLCAKAMAESLADWTESGRRGRGFNVDDKKLAEEIYDLFGYGALTLEIVEYLFGLLEESKEFRPVKLFERLKEFYEQWCEGEYIDAPPHDNYPQKTMLRLSQQELELKAKDKLGLRQVDIYTGLNVLILLLELQRYGIRNKLQEEMSFHLCGKVNKKDIPEDKERLFRVIGYSRCAGNFAFLDIVGSFLSGANLLGSFLSGADLRGADLIGADLRDADLIGANLRGANLRGANLIGTDLRRAVLSGADFSGDQLSDRVSGDIKWDEGTNWEGVKGLETAINVPKALKEQLALE